MTAMTAMLRRATDRLLGRGEAAVTLPPMDGALLPNTVLEQAPALAQLAKPDNLLQHGNRVLCSSGNRVLQLDPVQGTLTPWMQFEAAVAAMVALPDQRLVVALVDGQLLCVEGTTSRALTGLGQYRGFCPTALLADGDNALIVLEGSAQHRCTEWKRDLMARGASGSVWRLDLARGDSSRLASRLAWPAGIARGDDGALVVAESWRHRLIKLAGQRTDVLLSDLPGYPGRMTPTADGGAWLALFAPRSQLVEFVLREKAYRLRMMSEIDERFWVAPALESGRDFREPLQGGAIKSMGILKPWAPTRSCGLLVRLDEQWQPRFSLHSRADGHRHGVTSALEHDGRLLIASQGGHCILGLPGDVSGDA
ncbi:strictosidine synthase [Alcanivorax sp. S71-1-4]|uniref:hypothetical protein n=1 Tax=Alcanivorax sp. S71-1-4 TaxID=1177159 RepID=UPI0016B0326D|nr:hypothetical protein [Alcanivorax sp. S71-1-4]KAF0811074.1 strictosidine synthase [Alcanivorax sp. S71-1-4]